MAVQRLEIFVNKICSGSLANSCELWFRVMKWDRAFKTGFIPCAIVSSGRGGYRGCQPLKAERRKLRHQPSPGKGQRGFGLYGYVKKTASSRTSQAVIRQGVTAVLSCRNNGVGVYKIEKNTSLQIALQGQ